MDGLIGDWGSNGNFSNDSWVTGLTGSHAGFTYKFHNDDLAGNAGHSAYLGPNQGGQDYDAEFLGVGRTGNTLYIMIVTGQRPDNGAANFSPGDIRIETSTGVYGVEVGGGGADGKTYKIISGSGYTDTSFNGSFQGSTFINGVATDTSSHKAGTIWKDGVWTADPIPSGGSTANGPPNFDGNEPVQLQFTGGTYAGAATDFVYNTAAGTQHAVIELAIDLNLFGVTVINRIQWAPGCGNDFVYLDNLGIRTPEPATLMMGLLGIAGVAGVRRFRRSDA